MLPAPLARRDGFQNRSFSLTWLALIGQKNRATFLHQSSSLDDCFLCRERNAVACVRMTPE